MTPMVRDNRGVFAGVGWITLAVIVTVIALTIVVTVFLYQPCVDAFQDMQNLYPGAALIESESNFLSYQRVVYHSDDAPEVIDSWYRQKEAAETRAAVTSGDFSNAHQTDMPASVDADAERGGSLITFAATCP